MMDDPVYDMHSTAYTVPTYLLWLPYTHPSLSFSTTHSFFVLFSSGQFRPSVLLQLMGPYL